MGKRALWWMPSWALACSLALAACDDTRARSEAEDAAAPADAGRDATRPDAARPDAARPDAARPDAACPTRPRTRPGRTQGAPIEAPATPEGRWTR
ncbi:MAG: hypothetical protein R3F60_13820 [bacterium]